MEKNKYELNYMDIAIYFYNNIEYINNLKLQKLMFFAYVEYYKKYKKELFKDNFEAWVYGPVLPELYYNFYKVLLNKEYNKKNINEKKDIKNVLDNIIKKYGKKDAFQLVDLTHEEQVWQNARNGLDNFKRSNKKLNIKEYLDKNEK